MFIKKAVENIASKPLKQLDQYLNKEFLLNFIFLTALKNYIYRCLTQEKIFIQNVPHELKNLKDKDKIILVLDMDQTLVHTRSLSKPSHGNYIFNNGQYIQKRPHLDSFLKHASSVFKIYVYTAGDKEYADQVLDCIDQNNRFIQKRFYRQHCKKQRSIVSSSQIDANGKKKTVNKNEVTYLKDLKHIKKLTKQKRQMILLDDNVDSTNKNYPFSVNIKPFEGDQNDTQLSKAYKTLLKFYGCRIDNRNEKENMNASAN